MPTYSYQCKECEHLFDVFHPMSAKPRIKCEECGSRCRRLIGTGAGIIFKGSGFYETDYRRKGANGHGDKSEDSKKTETSTKSDSSAKSGDSGKSDSKGPAASSSGASSSSSSSGD